MECLLRCHKITPELKLLPFSPYYVRTESKTRGGLEIFLVTSQTRQRPQNLGEEGRRGIVIVVRDMQRDFRPLGQSVQEVEVEVP
jgi:hypothetical protein